MRQPWLPLALFGACLAAPASAQGLPRTDISWIAEHLPESVQDARLLTLPWPGRPLQVGRRRTTFDLGGTRRAPTSARSGE